MAALLLSFAGASLGGALLGPLGVVGGRIVGVIAGSVIDRALFAGKRQIEGPRLSDLDVMASTEGAPIARVYGRARVAGTLIWATIITPDKAGVALTIVGVASAVLRFFTSTPVFEQK